MKTPNNIVSEVMLLAFCLGLATGVISVLLLIQSGVLNVACK